MLLKIMQNCRRDMKDKAKSQMNQKINCNKFKKSMIKNVKI